MPNSIIAFRHFRHSSEKRNHEKPLLCPACGLYVIRLEAHLLKIHKFAPRCASASVYQTGNYRRQKNRRQNAKKPRFKCPRGDCSCISSRMDKHLLKYHNMILKKVIDVGIVLELVPSEPSSSDSDILSESDHMSTEARCTKINSENVVKIERLSDDNTSVNRKRSRRQDTSVNRKRSRRQGHSVLATTTVEVQPMGRTNTPLVI